MLAFRGRYYKTGRGTPNFKICFRVILGVEKMIINLVFKENHYFAIYCVLNIFDLERICIL